MFNAIIQQSELESFTNPLSTLVDECELHLDEDGVHVQAVDPANVAMVGTDLDAGAFEAYEADGGVIGINLSRFEDVISMADSGDLVHIELDEETRKLTIQIGDLEYTLALLDPDSIRQEPDIPDLDLPATIVLEGRNIDRGVRAADMVSDHIRLRVGETDAGDDDVFVIEAAGDTDDVTVELDSEDVIDLMAADADSLFSLDYLKDMNKAISADDEVTILLGEEYPVKLFYDIAEGQGSCQFMLSPRVST